MSAHNPFIPPFIPKKVREADPLLLACAALCLFWIVLALVGIAYILRGGI